jgi:hypothetical protein
MTCGRPPGRRIDPGQQHRPGRSPALSRVPRKRQNLGSGLRVNGRRSRSRATAPRAAAAVLIVATINTAPGIAAIPAFAARATHISPDNYLDLVTSRGWAEAHISTGSPPPLPQRFCRPPRRSQVPLKQSRNRSPTPLRAGQPPLIKARIEPDPITPPQVRRTDPDNLRTVIDTTDAKASSA